MNIEEAENILKINPYIILNDSNIDPNIIFELAENLEVNTYGRYVNLFLNEYSLTLENFTLFNSKSLNSKIIHTYIEELTNKLSLRRIRVIKNSLVDQIVFSSIIEFETLLLVQRYSQDSSRIFVNSKCDTDFIVNNFFQIVEHLNNNLIVSADVVQNLLSNPNFPIELIKRIFKIPLKSKENKYENFKLSRNGISWLRMVTEDVILRHPSCPPSLIRKQPNDPFVLIKYKNCPKDIFDKCIEDIIERLNSPIENITTIDHDFYLITESKFITDDIILNMWKMYRESKDEIMEIKFIKRDCTPLEILSEVIIDSKFNFDTKINALESANCSNSILVYSLNFKDLSFKSLMNKNCSKELYKLSRLLGAIE